MSEPNTHDRTCIFCALIDGVEHGGLRSRPGHVVYRDAFVTAFVSSHQWPGRLPNVLVVPNVHYRDVFEVPIEMAPHIHRIVKLIAQALVEAFGCDGITVRQNNRSSAGQDVFHHHTHVMARYRSDPGYPALDEKTLWDAGDLDHMADQIRRAINEPATEDFHRSLPRKRMGAGAILTDTTGRVLIVKPTYKDYWEIPGGAVEEGESPWQACRREVSEELGLDLAAGHLLCVDYNPTRPGYLESLMFVFDGGVLDEAQSAAIDLRAAELSEWRFAERDEALDLLGHRVGGRLRTVWNAHDPTAVVYLEDHRRIN